MDKYREYLKAIFNTRLLFNARQELADYIGYPSLMKNGVDKLRSDFQCRAIFSELDREYEDMTGGYCRLDDALDTYRKASEFYSVHLRNYLNVVSKEERLFDLLDYRYGFGELPEDKKVAKVYERIYNKVEDEEYISVVIITMVALHILPTYQSRSSDVTDIIDDAHRLMDFLGRFVRRNEVLDGMPMIRMMLDDIEEDYRSKPDDGLGRNCRGFLICCAMQILDRFRTFTSPVELQQLMDGISLSGKFLDIEGFWTERWPADTVFWQITDCGNNMFFLFRWQFNTVSHAAHYVRYTMQLADNNKTCILLAPWYVVLHASGKLPKGKPYSAYYTVEIDNDNNTSVIKLEPYFRSDEFPSFLTLKKVLNNNGLELFNKIITDYDITDEYAEYRYGFTPSARAVTVDALYIDSPHGLLRIPFERNPEFSNPSFYDRIGYMTAGNKLYIVYDERDIFIDASDLDKLYRELGIKAVDNVEISD